MVYEWDAIAVPLSHLAQLPSYRDYQGHHWPEVHVRREEDLETELRGKTTAEALHLLLRYWWAGAQSPHPEVVMDLIEYCRNHPQCLFLTVDDDADLSFSETMWQHAQQPPPLLTVVPETDGIPAVSDVASAMAAFLAARKAHHPRTRDYFQLVQWVADAPHLDEEEWTDEDWQDVLLSSFHPGVFRMRY